MKQHELAFKVLDILSNGKFHSGELMAKELGCSRVAIWKALSEIKELNIPIFSVRNKGYRLPEAIFVLNKEKVLRSLGEVSQFINLELNHVVESTNTILSKNAANTPHATVMLTNLQTKGKGRRGRVWNSSLGESLTFSILWKFNLGAAQLSGLSLAVGLALQRVMQKIGLQNTCLKWPNDLLVRGESGLSKLAGTLIELQGDLESRSSAVIGVGLNYTLSSGQQKKIDQPAIGLTSILKEAQDPHEVLAMLIKEIIAILSVFEKSQFKELKAEWLESNAFQNELIQLSKSDGTTIRGRIVDLEDDGSLILEQETGDQIRLNSGEISAV
jgi:BirA family biotin operon repressor/biotin-[acetyl-CoA-carboxylase] ligase